MDLDGVMEETDLALLPFVVGMGDFPGFGDGGSDFAATAAVILLWAMQAEGALFELLVAALDEGWRQQA